LANPERGTSGALKIRMRLWSRPLANLWPSERSALVMRTTLWLAYHGVRKSHTSALNMSKSVAALQHTSSTTQPNGCNS